MCVSSCGSPSVFTMTLPFAMTIASFERSCRIAMSADRVAVDDEDVGALAFLDRPALVLEAQQLGAVLRGRDDRLHRREAHVGHEQLDVLRVLAVRAPHEAVVAARHDAHAGLAQLVHRHAAHLPLVLVLGRGEVLGR